MNRSTTLALTSAALLGGCLADRAFPDDANIPCDTVADCPSGYACHPGSARCIVGGDIDVELPTVTALIHPLRAGARDIVTITLDVSEELMGDPAIETTGPDTFVLDESLTVKASRHWVFRAELTDTRDTDVAVTAALRDLQGNDATVDVGVFTVDNTGPTDALPPQIEGGPAADDGVEVRVILNEATARPPFIDIAPRFDHPGYTLDVFHVPSGVDGEDSYEWEGIYTRVGDEPVGVYDVILTAQDLAGNTNVIHLGTVELLALE